MHVKVTSKWTSASMDSLLSLSSRAFKDVKLSKCNYNAKRYLRRLGLGCESIHVCKWDYALFWKENARMETVPFVKLVGG